jgi:hypothetical protein
MSSDILTWLFEQLLLIEGLVLGVTLVALLLRRRYLLNRPCCVVHSKPDPGAQATPWRRVANRPDAARRLHLVR